MSPLSHPAWIKKWLEDEKRRLLSGLNARMRILVLCSGNVARSQMLAGFLRQRAPEGVEVYSAGTKPEAQLWPPVVEAMREVGVDLSQERPKGIEAVDGPRFDYVISVCDAAKEACPVWPDPATVRLHRSFPDPRSAENGEKAVRAVRDELQKWADELAAMLFAASQKPRAPE